jgi:hypothetical protein
MGNGFGSCLQNPKPRHTYNGIPPKIKDLDCAAYRHPDNVPMPDQHFQSHQQPVIYPHSFPAHTHNEYLEFAAMTVPSQAPEERYETPDLDGYASSVDTRSSGWQSRGGSRRASTQGERDKILVDSRVRGMSYKDIKRDYHFTEAESTLRGRYRTLTKDKKDRVRKPEWADRDVRIRSRHFCREFC